MRDQSISRYSMIDHMICSPEIEVDGYMLTYLLHVNIPSVWKISPFFAECQVRL